MYPALMIKNTCFLTLQLESQFTLYTFFTTLQYHEVINIVKESLVGMARPQHTAVFCASLELPGCQQTFSNFFSFASFSGFCRCSGVKFQTTGDVHHSAHTISHSLPPRTTPPQGRSLGDILKSCSVKEHAGLNIQRIFKILKSYCNQPVGRNEM